MGNETVLTIARTVDAKDVTNVETAVSVLQEIVALPVKEA